MLALAAGSGFSSKKLWPLVYNNEPFFDIESEEVDCYMRPRAFGRIMRYKRLFLLVLLVAIECVAFAISADIPGQNSTSRAFRKQPSISM